MPNPERAPLRLHHEPEAVRWARDKAGLTQTQLAERAGIARTLLVEIEAGTRNLTPANLLKVAEALNCPPVVLEKKRVPSPTTPADVDLRDLRGAERTESHDLPERGAASEVEQAAS